MPNEIYHKSNWGNANAEGFGDVYFDAAATNKLYNHSDYYENSNGTDKILRDLSNKASIVLTPTAYSDGSLNTVIPPYQVLPTELVTNGDFSNGTTSWTPNTNATLTIDNGRLKVAISGAGSGYPSQSITTVVGKKYKITADAFIGTATKVSLYSAAFGFNDLTADGSYNLTFTATSASTQIRLYVYGDGTFGFWDNISIKEIQEADFDFSRGSSATRVNEKGLIEDVQILSGNLVQNGNFEQIGSELVTNGGFDTDSDWVKGNGWIISGGKAILVDGLDPTYQIYQSISGLNTKNLKVTFDVTDFSGDAELRYPFRENITGNGSYTFYGVGTLDRVQFQVKSGFTASFSIDNVSVKEVGQNWSFETGWSMGDGKAIYDGVTTSLLQSNYSMTASNKYRATIQVIDTSGSGNCRFAIKEDNNTAIAFTTYAEGTITLEFTSPTSGLFGIDASSSEGSFDITSVSVIEITDDTDLPRIDYTSGFGSLLLEPQRTNLITYSEALSNWTNIQNVTVTDNVAISPDGGQNASRINETTSSSVHRLFLNPTVSSEKHTYSVFLKKGTRSWAYLRLDGAQGDQRTWFDLENGILGTVNADHIASIENFGNGWYRCTVSIAGTTYDTTPLAILALATDNNASSYTGSTDEYIYAWGAQLEELSYPTSYIPTSGSTVTRSADVANNSGNADLINSTEGVLYAEIAYLSDTGTYRTISINDGTNNNVVALENRPISNQIKAFVNVSGVNVMNSTQALTNVKKFNKIAIKWKQDDFAWWVNGVQIHEDLSGSTFGSGVLNKLNFNNGIENFPFEGKAKELAVFKEALTDAELESLTSWVSFTEMATDLEYTLE